MGTGLAPRAAVRRGLYAVDRRVGTRLERSVQVGRRIAQLAGTRTLADIWTVETTSDRLAFDAKVKALKDKFVRVEAALGEGPYFAGARFCVVDAVFAPVFRYFDVFDDIVDLGVFAATPKVRSWRRALSQRESVKRAVAPNYRERLAAFLTRHAGIITELPVAA